MSIIIVYKVAVEHQRGDYILETHAKVLEETNDEQLKQEILEILNTYNVKDIRVFQGKEIPLFRLEE
ncbi:MAG: hypothetical protein DRP00_04965 [Candidatus Aenigmatarchaeota archaeon]|nr:MAG: hypothetical protein DRP00_04965 [Candidatus Aenigmarchaeota archaeon]